MESGYASLSAGIKYVIRKFKYFHKRDFAKKMTTIFLSKHFRPSQHWIIFVLLILIALLVSACAFLNPNQQPELLQITYTAETGSVEPMLQWFEQYTIYRNTALSSDFFERTGKANRTQVNQGSWILEPDKQAHEKLFTALDALDLDSIKPIEPEDIPDGAGTERYELKFADGTIFSLDYTPGMDYTNGELVTGPVQEYIESLVLPDDAVSRFTFDE